MLIALHIQNYAIIDSIQLKFESGLNIITGETGAGKSILLGALGLIMGKRVSGKIWFDEQAKCVIEATFQIGHLDLQSFFDKHDFDDTDPLIIRREITPSGKSRAFINDTPAGLKQLQELSAHLIELHQQFDTLELHRRPFQAKFYDIAAGIWKHFEAYSKLFNDYTQLKKEHSALLEEIALNLRDKSYLEFQLQELEELNLQSGEEEVLESDQKKLSHAADIKRALQSNISVLYESEPAILSILKEHLRALEQIQDVFPEVTALNQRYDSIIIELDDIVQELGRLDDSVMDDPTSLIKIENRLEKIFALRQKHGVTSAEELIELQQQFNDRLSQFEDFKTREQALAQRVAESYQSLISSADQLTQLRMKNKDAIEGELTSGLKELGMTQARVSFEFESMDSPGPYGKELIDLHFSANKGTALQAIKDIASGGEISRINLKVKTMIAHAVHLPTLIFDEIDTGISGEVAKTMGKMLKNIGRKHQVISITHSPMIAALGDLHLFVSKDHSGNKTTTQIHSIEGERRIREIAVMLGGDPPSETSIKASKELLAG